MKSKELIDVLMKNLDLEIGSVSFYVYKPFGVDKSKWAADYVKVFGHFEKNISGKIVYLYRNEGGICVYLNEYDTCKIVGKKYEKRSVAVTYEDKVVPVNVTDCEIKSGMVDETDVVFNEPAAVPVALPSPEPALIE